MQTAHVMRDSMRSLQSQMFGQSAMTPEDIEARIQTSPFQKGAARRMRGIIFTTSVQEIVLLVILAIFTLAQFVLPFPNDIYDFAFAYYVWNFLGAALGLLVRGYGNARGPYVILLLVRIFILGVNATAAVLTFIRVTNCIIGNSCGSDLIYYVSYLVFAVIVLFFYSIPIPVNVTGTLRLFQNSALKIQ